MHKNINIYCPNCQKHRQVRYHIRFGKSRVSRCRECANIARLVRPTKNGKPRAMCVHCKSRVAGRSKGLCQACTNKPEIRLSYGFSDKGPGRRSYGLFTGEAPDPPAPTTALPGSPEKVAVMQQRAQAGYKIFHKGDYQDRGR